MISEMMKSRMPSVWRSIRELWLASGGPWWWDSAAA